eukprot:m.90973 g.90973  ORF g.90973 m.90973 type:complete len:884 (-) comp13284_c0_seq3:145-2796(-)
MGSGCGNSVMNLSQGVEKGVSKLMSGLAGMIHKKTLLWLIIPAAIAILLTSGFAVFKEEGDADDLYTSADSESKRDEEYIANTWGDPGEPGTIYGVGKSDGANVLTKDALLDLMTAYETVRDTTGTYQGETVTWETRCTKTGDYCYVYSILDVWNYNRTALAADSDILGTINNIVDNNVSTPAGDIISSFNTMGKIVRDDIGRIVSCEAFQMKFQLDNVFEEIDGVDKTDPRRELFELDASSNVRDLDMAHLDAFTNFGVELGEGISATFARDGPLVAVGYFLLLLYARIVLGKANGVASYASMAVWSLIAVVLAIVAAYGFALLLGVPWTSQALILAFLLLGLGIDDTFIIVSAFDEDHRRSMEPYDRIKSALASAGSAITVTSFSDAVAFAVGATSKIPVIEYFCAMGAIGIMFDYALQITFVVAALVLTQRREAANRYDCLPCIVSSEDPNDRKKTCRKNTPFVNGEKGMMHKFFSGTYSDAILSPTGRIVVVVCGLALFGSSCWAALQVESEFDVEWLVGDFYYLHDSWDVRDEYFGGGKLLPIEFYTKDADYSSAAIQEDMDSLATDVQNFKYLESCTPGYWIQDFNEYALSQNITTPVVGALFNSTLTAFLASSAGNKYESFILFKDGVVISTKFSCLMAGLGTVSDGIVAMDDARNIADKYDSLGAIAYSFPFLFWDGQNQISEEIVLNLILSGAAVFVMTAILLGNIWGAFLVLAMVAMTDFTVLAFFWYSTLYFNVATAFYLVIAVGLTVDYSSHLCHTFLHATGTNTERAKEALGTVGAAVFHGGFTTFLACLPLSFASSYVFRTQFTALALIIFFGMIYGLVFLPVLLSLIGPASLEEESVKLGKVEGDKVTPKEEEDVPKFYDNGVKSISV